MPHTRRTNTHRVISFCGIALAALIAVVDAGMAQPTVSGQPLTAQMVECASIRDETRRLECFDRAIARLTQPDKRSSRTFVGEGNWTSDLVTMDQRWYIEWRPTGQMLAVELLDVDNYFKGVAGSQVGPGEGSSNPLAPGSYRINVRAIGGAWKSRYSRRAANEISSTILDR